MLSVGGSITSTSLSPALDVLLAAPTADEVAVLAKKDIAVAGLDGEVEESSQVARTHRRASDCLN